MSSFSLGSWIGAVGLLLLGIFLLSGALEACVGPRARKFMARFDRKPLLALMTGTLVTLLLQSSSATTILIAGLAHAGLLSVGAAVAAVMGANIGTTFSAQLLALPLGPAAGWLIGIGVILLFKGKSSRSQGPPRRGGSSAISEWGQGVLGLGLMFWAVTGLNDLTSPLADDPAIRARLSLFQQQPLGGVIAGFLLTTALDSSTAAVALLQNLLREHLLTLEGAVPILFGDNIGTTTATVLAAFALGPKGRRVGAAHFFFNSIGTILFWPLQAGLISLSRQFTPDPALQLAHIHFLFNAANAGIQYPMRNLHVELGKRLFPERGR